jgi:hypothetical protein
MEFNRSNTSPRYVELLDLYQEYHSEGDEAQDFAASETYPGRSLLRHIPNIRQLVDSTGARSLLDYGAGKGLQYEWRNISLRDGTTISSVKDYWGIETVTCYDGAYPPFTTLPSGTFDAVICTDVLEHIPEQDIPWVLDELFGFATKFVYANIACHPAKAILPNGENAHCTVKPESWWAARVRDAAAKKPDVRYRFICDRKYKTFGLIKRRRFTPIEG